ncbi:hypothetical protein F5X68DRAFT_232217 [Plectosphaerella plurivora]|uniref:Uncharacterized protein n=1 Tax=Plectosphaerella plurivora TaxID=936078 RepID=A0A9P9AAS7_9PEZI|nr:hypothetical protein F5X68DRAFT_232217 [Plectosphaerella plurivora]
MATFQGYELPPYGEFPEFAEYSNQGKRGKLVNSTQAVAFAHSFRVDGDGVGKDLTKAWPQEGQDLLDQATSTLDPILFVYFERLVAVSQVAIKSVCPSTEADIIKIGNANLFHLVEEACAKLPMFKGCTFRSLAEHDTPLVKKSEAFRIKKMDQDGQPIIKVKGPASLRPDVTYYLGRDYRQWEPLRFGDASTTAILGLLEYKGLEHLPVAICHDVVTKSSADFDAHFENVPSDTLTSSDLENWERRKAASFTHWDSTGSAEDVGGFGSARQWMKQKTGYSVGHNARYVLGFNYTGLILMRFHRLKRHDDFHERWNLGRGAGSCCQMAVYPWKENRQFLPAIIGFLAEAQNDCFAKGEGAGLSVGDPMDIDSHRSSPRRRGWGSR